MSLSLRVNGGGPGILSLSHCPSIQPELPQAQMLESSPASLQHWGPPARMHLEAPRAWHVLTGLM